MAEKTFWKNDSDTSASHVICACCGEKIPVELSVCPSCDFPFEGAPDQKANAINTYELKLKKKTRFFRFLTYPVMGFYAIAGIISIVMGFVEGPFIGMVLLGGICGLLSWWVLVRPFWSSMISLGIVFIMMLSIHNDNALVLRWIAIPFFLAFAGGLWISLMKSNKK